MRCAILAGLVCLLPLTCFGGGWIELDRPRRHIRRPAPQPPLPLEVTRHHVDVRAIDGWAEVRVDQSFRNPGPRVAEGTYFFPVPRGAAVEDFRATLGDKELVGEVLEAEAARRIYRDLVRKMIDPAILEFYDRALYKARVFPIPAGGVVRLQLTYRHRLPRSGDLYELSYPFDSARFCGGQQLDVRFEARLEDSTIASIHSPTHDVRVEGRKGAWLVTYEASALRSRKALELEILTSRAGLAGGVRAFRPNEEDGYFVLRLAPGRTVSAERPSANIVFVLDTSGSMSGEKIEHAKQALISGLRRLDRHDRFAILTFSSGVEEFAPAPTIAEPDAVRRAIEFVRTRVARGGTHLAAAIEHAVSSAHAFPTGATIVLSSDGAPTVGETDPRTIVKLASQKNGGDHRLHVLGLGADVETVLLDDLARKNGGSRTYLASSRRLEATISSLLDKVLEPCLSDLRLLAPGLTLSGLEPEAPYDVFHGEDLVVTGRYRGRSHGSIEIRGRVGNETKVFVFDAEFPERGGDEVAAFLWAENR
ncbi:MAG: VIT domain-containing protein, partial [Planctomycetota bacterium]